MPQRLIMPLAFALVGLAAAVSATGFFLYDRATEPDRSTPIVSTDALLHAILIEKSPDRAGLYVCSQWSVDRATSILTGKLNPQLSVSWGNFLDSTQADQARVRVQIRLSAGGTTSINRWEFVVVKENGWRVCGARDLGPLETRPG